MRGDEVDINPVKAPVPEPQVDEDEELLVVKDIAPKLSAREKFYKQAHLAGKVLRFSARIPMEVSERVNWRLEGRRMRGE